ncbi:hypothetical protein EII17_00770 [Clostridiales bacterium COT073_COT-073]|nr:hypothetical protein EII17_00770 [Clostridiales bacterium COT073_COT-073]
MRLFEKYLKNNRGATSVLIMIMMIILMIFGLAALTTSVASKKLAQKNASWLKEYYALNGEAIKAYAYLEDTLDLDEAGVDVDRIENSLIRFLKSNANCSFQKNDDEQQPFLIEMQVHEQGKEFPKSIHMEFVLEKREQSFQLKTKKWSQYQAEFFNPEDEPHFSDIKVN